MTFLQKYHYLYLSILFILLYSIAYAFVTNDEKKRTNIELVNALERTSVEYKLIYNIYKKNSRLIFKQFVNKPKILQIMADINTSNKDIQRKKLYNQLKVEYALGKKLGIKLVQFHLPNNESFLRMHKLEKYGDNLSKYRYCVGYVNRFHKPISGFEQGKVIDGFRFVYPLSKDNKHIGSVEVSVNTQAFKTLFDCFLSNIFVTLA